MGELFIIKVGTTFPNTAAQFGDFDHWTCQGLGIDPGDSRVVDVANGDALPSAADCRGVVVTGSHAMVTDDLPWSRSLSAWIPGLIDVGVPFLGICYGHQLLAQALGGRVGFHPAGKEIGTVGVRLMPASRSDPLFGSLPPQFRVQVTHAQTVLALPINAVRLAANAFEAHQAFRIGPCAWGVQFHPEYHAGIMAAYIKEQADALEAAGRNVFELLNRVCETPVAAAILKNFARISGR